MRKTYIILLLLCTWNIMTAQKVNVTNADGVKEFDNLPAALACANTSSTESTVTLLDDIDVKNSPLTLSGTMTLDLNGYQLYGYAQTMIDITNGARVTLADSKGGGVIFQDSDPESTTISVTSGTLHITSGEIRNVQYNKNESCMKQWGVTVCKDGTLNMSGGSINVECTRAAYGVNVNGGTVTINDGKINVKCLRDGAAIYIPSARNVSINGGEIIYNSGFGEYHDIVTNVSTDRLSIKGGRYLHEGNLRKYSGDRHVTVQDGLYTISDSPMTTKAAMIKHTERIFDTVEEALAATAEGDTVVVTNDCTMTANATVKRGTVLLVPYDMAGTCYTKHPEATFHHMEEYVYRTLTIADGVTLTVEGEMSVSARQSSAEGGQFCGAGACHGPHGAVRMGSGALIDVKDGAGLYCWGYISGKGRVEMRNGSALYEALQITDWRGGTISYAISDTTFPFNQYYVQNVEVPVRFHYGSRNMVATDLFFGYSEGSADKEMHRIDDISFINNDGTGLFRTQSNTVVERTYDSATDRMAYIIDGDVELGSIAVDIYDSDSYILSIPNNMTITQRSGSITVNNRYIISAGARITVAPEAIMRTNSNSALYVMGKKDWDCFAALGYVLPLEYTMANGHDNRTVRWHTKTTGDDAASYAKLTDGVLDVQGTLLCNGAVMTSGNSAGVVCTAERQAETETGTKYYGGRITREGPLGTDTLLMCMRKTDTLKKVPVVPMTLRDADNSSLATDKLPGASSAFVYDNGGWHILGDANGDRRVSMADANMVTNHISGTTTPTLSRAAADTNGNGKVDRDDIKIIVQKFME